METYKNFILIWEYSEYKDKYKSNNKEKFGSMISKFLK